MTTTVPPAVLRTGLKDFSGELVGPDDPGYDDVRQVYNASIDRRPALIARPRGPADVALAVTFARDHQLPVAVRGGGHHGAGLGTVDDGVVIDLHHLREIDVDAGARTVSVGGGATWGEVDQATNAFGLATPSGIISSTGVGGLTLGGGIGHLTRRHGLAVDNLLAADVVLADGRRVTASAAEHRDLFWAIRGGGGNFGVVTRFVLRLHEVSTVVAGPVFWPVEQTAEVLAAYRDFLPAAPRDLNAFFLVGAVPPAAPFPEELQLRTVCGVVVCWTGEDEAAAEAALAPLLAATPAPLLKALAPMPHPVMQSMFDGVYPKGDQWYWRADFVNEIPDEALAVHARYGRALPTWKSTMHLYPVDGAAHDVGSDETSWSYREATWAAVYAGVDPDPDSLARIRQWSIDYFEDLHPYSAGGAYVNMMMDEGQDRVRASYRGNYPRLAAIKAEYDPENLFRVNQNIRPAG